ncbi:hypothetical protein F383_20011 [Gossypium arboreum]|uniref:Uncharacterized protein n=1 Tax=Gossypium arboreum TaxID=29729 RepID=A0A0B0NCA2_GOSAR|nr:hypothetical protein F383_20011 [Gossypium arboreum]
MPMPCPGHGLTLAHTNDPNVMARISDLLLEVPTEILLSQQSLHILNFTIKQFMPYLFNDNLHVYSSNVQI